MAARALRRRNLRTFAAVVAGSALAGAAYGLPIGLAAGNTLRGLLQGAATGAAIATWCAGYDLWLLRSAAGPRLRRLGFTPHIAMKTLYYLAGILLGLLGVNRLAAWLAGEPAAPPDDLWRTVALSLAIAFAINFVLMVNQMLGQNVLPAFVTGRYRRPRTEERVFLFVDMVGSTRTAERIGPEAFLELLDRFVGDLTKPALATGGEIYRYVGDEMIVSWPMQRGVRQARCLLCLDAMQARMTAAAAGYRQRWDVAPRFRAALHAGAVVVGEMGEVRREIVFLGDTLNTAARLEDLARELDRDAVISAALLRRLALPAGFAVEPLGCRALRGREAPVEVFALLSPHADTGAAAA